MERKVEVAFHPSVVDYLEQLMFILYQKGYFSYTDTALEYVDKMIEFIHCNIYLQNGRIAPKRFQKEGLVVRYFNYQSNRSTTWYIFYSQSGNRYLVLHISNNHESGHLL